MLRSKILSGFRCGFIILALLSVAGAAPGDSKEKSESPSPRPIVSTGSLWRFHMTMRPICYLDPQGKLRLRGKVRRYCGFLCSPTYHQVTTDPPPQDWTGADFDDSSWPVVRMPTDMPQAAGGRNMRSPDAQFVRRMCTRTRFLVPDPGKVRDLKLKIRYYGGVIAWVNGHEVGRGHIPSNGSLAKEGYAEPYPVAAYQAVDPKHVELAKKHKLVLRRSGKWHFYGPGHRKYKKYAPEAQTLIRQVNALRCRELSVDIPSAHLRRGANVLSIEKRCAPLNEARKEWGAHWSHGSIRDVALYATPDGSVLSAEERPQGVQVWAEDIHQWVRPESFLEPGVRQKRILRLTCARRGACSGQVVISTTQKLEKPSAKPGKLTGPGGIVLPEAAMTVRWARPVNVRSAHTKGIGRGGWTGIRMHVKRAALSRGHRTGNRKDSFPAEVFDPLASEAPAAIGPDTSRPVWLTINVPPDATPGRYTGILAVSAAGMTPVQIEVRLYVFDWTLPPLTESTAYAGIDESPWSLADWAKVKPWSPKHWKLVEDAMAWAGKLGARVAGVPVIHDSDMRNRKDPMVTWVKSKIRHSPAGDGGKGNDTYDYDFTLMDRYLKLWQKYSHKNSDVIVYLTLSTVKSGYYTCGGPPGMVTLRDPKTGEEKPFHPLKPGETPSKKWLSRKLSEVKLFSADSPGIKRWIQCARAVRAHLNELGFSDNRIHWGMYHDSIEPNSKVLAEALAEAIPTVGWARVSHYFSKQNTIGKGQAFISWSTAIRGAENTPFSMKCSRKKEGRKRYKFGIAGTYRVESCKGWSNPDNPLALARDDSDNMSFSLYPPLWQLRKAMELPITATYRGISRFSIDGWARQGYYGPYISFLTYPDTSKTRMLGSVQFEALREGLQEAEARIFLEKQESVPAAAQKVLDRRTERVWIAPACSRGQSIMEYHHSWQESSWDLYAAATKAAGGKPPTKADKERFFRHTAVGSNSGTRGGPR